MAPRAILLVVPFLLVGACLAAEPAAKIKCVENPQAPDEGEGFCLRCAADGMACEECSQYSVLTAGDCIPCAGRGEFGAYCSVCNSTKGPEFCVACRDLNGEQDNGVYATAAGECALCPLANCTACTTPDGTCTSCAQGQGLVGGACVECANQDTCYSCDGDAAKCSECSQGLYPDATGACQTCLANCTFCSSATTCDTCTTGTTWDAATATCAPCQDKGCLDCSAPGNCTACDTGFGLQSGKCSPCPEGCGTCDTSLTACDQDSSCLDGYGPGDKPNTCVACSINNCTSCDASYKICTMCSDGFRFNAPAEKCEACTVALCKQCDSATTTCDFCQAGYRVGSTGACEPCKTAKCAECTDSADVCDWCIDNYELDDAGVCQPIAA